MDTESEETNASRKGWDRGPIHILREKILGGKDQHVSAFQKKAQACPKSPAKLSSDKRLGPE